MAHQDDIFIIEKGAPEYPARLLDLDNPPEQLYVRGSLRWLAYMKTVAIVGSRKATVRGVRLARRIAKDLAEAGVVVISGGALGVDAAAHRGCLEGKAPTISVLAGGVDRPTPVRNADVFANIIGRGALVSEYPPGTRPRPFYFHRRNDLIAALGDATLVVRAKVSSGTMITARAARKLERPLCALPGELDDPLVKGCLELLVEGAQCVRNAADILEHVLEVPAARAQLNLRVATKPSRPNGAQTRASPDEESSEQAAIVPSSLSEDGLALYKAIREMAGAGGEGVGVDQLKRQLEWSAARLNSALLEAELAGCICKRAGANVYRPC
ncbi:DNA-protecting protein DprA [Persicimonas caeni]|uniref:DNA-protecting protein DprA n=1 Tax=Persicimonas caeni TaxID=2292766 RepID=A0A4Y6Q3G9_PERCE|nr:DNA-processing protein DprA [Persicimonas caeni]QDG54707.1 DNA-protecting protein DprA [Persicimonas caeni]QED35928.1 DNA-protecting protein DprA [Persicimonas caeni]